MLKRRQRFDKYRIVRPLSEGGFAEVYEAVDTIEGVRVALKMPHAHLVSSETLDQFRREVRHTARLDHPNIVPIKTASMIEGKFVIVQPLGESTLADRLERRLTTKDALDYAEQLLAALAHAHEERVIHCDVKPENILLFRGDRLRLADFGISRVALRTIAASGTGTLGYMAPEQALGKPSFRSDVFSAGLVIWRMLTRELPEWPYRPPLLGQARVRAIHPDLATFLLKALTVDERARFRDAGVMLAAFRRLRPRVLARVGRTARRRRRGTTAEPRDDWKAVRWRAFRRRHGRSLGLDESCSRCDGPVAHAMLACPWCGDDRRVHRGEPDFPAQCPRCKRGVKLDWEYCAWCWGAAIGPLATRRYSDRRYGAACAHCREPLMPFMRYCPWCRRKVTRRWPIEGSRDRCKGCGSGIVADDWSFCPWCRRRVVGRRRSSS